jgi:4'-phosphopantetheinyl transferase
VSWSRTAGHVHAVADHGPVGVDLERVDGLVPGPVEQGLLERFTSARERAAVGAAADPRSAFLRLWVGKESLVKLGACGLDDLATVDLLGLLTDPTGQTAWQGHDVRAWTAGGFVLGHAAC